MLQKILPTESDTLGMSDIHPLPRVAGCTLLSAPQMGEALYPCKCAEVIRECVAGQLQQDQSLRTLLGIQMSQPPWREDNEGQESWRVATRGWRHTQSAGREMQGSLGVLAFH